MKSKNIMERIPKRNDKLSWKCIDESVTIIVFRNSPFEKLLNKIFRKPKVVRIELESIGSKVWNLCDGNRNIYEISEKIKEEYGEKIEPAIPRLLKYLTILNNNGYIKI
ncbi:PqqD family protein [Clostridium senegalense]|uniref:PqqD family protein n=1 Tax=Clostridium senegalense TaxID=1465809 RepID=UPI0002887F75|nr:PqqD family protein [Clostridium senegalense]